MTTRLEFFKELLRDTTGRIELRRLKWNPHKNNEGGYDMRERLFSRDIAELEEFASNGGGDVFHGVALRDGSGEARKKNILEIVCADADIDFKTTPKEQADESLNCSIFEPTFLISSGHGYHPYWLLEEPLPATKENIQLIEAINKGLAQQFGGDYTHDVTRILRTPGRQNSKYTDGRKCEILRACGPRYSIEDLKRFAVSENSNSNSKVEVGDGAEESPLRFKKLLAKHSLIQKTWCGERPDLKDQSRSGYDMAMANLLAVHKFTPAQATTILGQMPSGKGAEASQAYLNHTIGKAFAAQTCEPLDEQSAEAVIKIENLTDLGNAKRFAVLHAGNVLYSAERKKWICWNGKILEWDIAGKIFDRVENVLKLIYEEAAHSNDKEQRITLAKHATKTESRRQIESMLTLAQTLPEIRVELAKLDRDPLLYNANNGTVELTTGEIRDFRHEDFITKISPTVYDPGAKCPLFDTFIEEITLGKKELATFIQRAAGYSTTSRTDEQCVFILYGSGGNGKSTLATVLRRVWGDNYAQQIKAEILCQSKSDSSTDYHIARLYGMRVAMACETELRRRLASALIKQWTGGEPLVGRRLYELPIEFTPIAKLWFSTNHLPQIQDSTVSIWRRIYTIPFDAKFDDEKGNRKKGYEDVLLQESSGILNWMIQGCLDWQRQGLNPPEIVLRKTAEYRAEEDLFANFIEDKCIIDPEEWVNFADLYRAYAEWCEAKGEMVETSTAFGRALTEKGYSILRNKYARGRQGLRLRTFTDDTEN